MTKEFYQIFPILIIYLHQTCGYQQFFLNDLCPSNPLKKVFNKFLDNKPEIRLGEDGNSAALVQQNWNSSSFKRLDECSFNVDIIKDNQQYRNGGMYATIKRLNFRRNGEDGNCIDYIRFKFGDRKTPKICGQIDEASPDYAHHNFDVDGKLIKVYITIDKLKPLHRVEDTLDVELVFTAYESCGGTYSIRCPSVYDNTCISVALQDDNIINCPPPDCSDESSKCPSIRTYGQPNILPNQSNIILSAITSLIFTLVAVGSCFWICWKIKDCWIGEVSGSPSNQASDRSHRTRTPGDTGTSEGSVALNVSSQQGSYYRPSAPPIEDKSDLPPSYDALFPDENNK